MTLSRTLTTYAELSRSTRANMHVRKSEFLTEIILSLFVVIMTIDGKSNVSVSVGAIAMIHSLNFARAIEAYKEAQVGQQELDDY